jgi:type II secretory pathway component GspD/PulD (secretin)
MTTSVQLRPGESLVIGGLIQHEITEIVSRIPILSEIPVLGQLFTSKRFNDDETELVIFITPYVLEDAAQSEEIVGVNLEVPDISD